MQDLKIEQIEAVNGGVAPLAIVAIDLALQAVFIGYLTYLE